MSIGNKIIRLESVDSTNRYLKEYRTELPNGAVVITKDQTRGRGRNDKKWSSRANKSLTFSFLVSDSIGKIYMPFFHLFPAVAVVRSLKSHSVDAKIKWPNDIYLNEKKIGGLLVQAMSQSRASDIIIGIGLNVREDENDFPVELHENVGSVFSLSGLTLDIETLFQSILKELNYVYDTFHHPTQWSKLQNLWCDQCAHLNKKITIFQKDKKVDGIFVGLDENGFAVIETDNKKIVVHDYDYVSLRAEHDTHD